MMKTIIQLGICSLLWVIVLVRWKAMHQKNSIGNDHVARCLWLALLFFAVALTFLVDSLSVSLDQMIANNLSRLISYSAGAIALYFFATFSMLAYQNRYTRQIGAGLQLSLIFTLISLVIIYVRHISAAPQWQDHHVPDSFAEAAFMFPLFAFAFITCVIQLYNNVAYLLKAKESFIRLRISIMTLSTLIGSMYAFVKIVLILGYFWPALGSTTLINLSVALLILMAFSFVAVLLVNDRLYQRLFIWNENIKNWFILADLHTLVACLDCLCPHIGLKDNKPGFHEFIRKPEYHLYRAIVRILDGQTMLADFIQDNHTACTPSHLRPDQLEDAREVNELLKTVRPSDNFWEMARNYRCASQRLLKAERKMKVSS